MSGPLETNPPAAASDTPPLRIGRKIAFASGDFAISASLSSLSLVFFFFVVEVAGLDPRLAGLVVWLARLIDAITDPLMGRISDRTRSRLGRRRPYLLIGALPLGITFALLWVDPGESQSLLFTYYLAVYVMLSLSSTILSVPYLALIPEMARDYNARTSLNAFRSGAAIFGTMVAATFIPLASAAGEGALGFRIVGSVLAVVIVCPWPLVFRASFETAGGRMPSEIPLIPGIKLLFRHRTFMRLCSLFISGRIAVDVVGLSLPFYMTYWIGRKDDVSWVLISMLVVVVLSLPVWLRVALRIDKHHLFMIGAGWWIAITGGMAFVDHTTPLGVLIGLTGLIGIGYAVADLMPWAMLGEVIDEDELASGDRREGLYNGVFTFLRKVGGATAYLIAGELMKFAGYDASLPSQPDRAVQMIWALTVITPVVFLGGAILIAARYPLGRREHAEILAILAAREESRGETSSSPR